VRKRAVVLIALAMTVGYAVEPGELADNQSRFGVIEGDVGFLSLGAKNWEVPHIGLPFESGDHIRTAEDGRVELQMTHDVLWVVEPESEVVVESANDHEGRVDLVEGTILGIIDKSETLTPQHWELNTPAATIVVHGTQLALQFSPKDGVRLGVFEGEVELQPADSASGEQPSVRVANGEVHLMRGKTAVKITPLSAVMKTFNARRGDLRRRQARAEEGWSFWNPDDRTSLRKKYVAPPPKPRRVRQRQLRLREQSDQDNKGGI